MTIQEKAVLSLLLPGVLMQRFEITGAEQTSMQISITLTEKNLAPAPPPEHRGKRIISKGFLREQSIQDFPLRGKALFLHLRRRKWIIEGVPGILSSQVHINAQGTEITSEFAAFLKDGD